ncbi:hypothetical protein MTR67_043630 [Solanum verrucosum]|uniref:Uncharacterized protein n=1 Tax=Solanum verrucosum TaxID=315347 RepID=A0AAF0UPF4_SOLVR|nr:hypothetical protein MTR67_043630 [Solanum verrucosum]
MKSVDNEEETEQVVLELFMCVVVLYQNQGKAYLHSTLMRSHLWDQTSEALIAPAMPSTTTRASGEYITYMGYGMMSAI